MRWPRKFSHEHIRTGGLPEVGDGVRVRGNGLRTAAPSRSSTKPAARNVSLWASKQQFASFDDMIQNSDTPILVDFYAAWCGPCQMVSAELPRFADLMEGAVKVVKIDTEKYPSVSSRHRVQGLPTLILFANGRELHRIEGYMTASQLADRVRYYIAAAANSS